MFRKLLSIALLAGCSQTIQAPSADMVPFRLALAENPGRPFECVAYDAATNSCEVIATYEDVDGGVLSVSRMVLAGDTPIEIRSTGVLEEREGRLCSNGQPPEITVTGASDFTNEAIAAELEFGYSNNAAFCAEFVRDGNGYLSVLRSDQGDLMSEEFPRSVFLAQEPRLRVIPFGE